MYYVAVVVLTSIPVILDSNLVSKTYPGVFSFADGVPGPLASVCPLNPRELVNYTPKTLSLIY